MHTRATVDPAAPKATLRILGVVVTAAGRAADIALVETDGGRLIRRIETERVPLQHGASAGALADALLRFMGDRALQPFAVDLIALDRAASTIAAAALERLVDVATCAVARGRGPAWFARAERVALAGSDLHLSGPHGGEA